MKTRDLIVGVTMLVPVAALGAGAPVPEVKAAAPPAIVVPRSLELPKGKLFVSDPTPDLELFATGDVIGYIDTCGCKLTPAGGIARRAWLVGQARQAFPSAPLVLLDTGNFTDVPTAAGDLRTQTLLTSMASLGYKAVGVGEKDLSLGYDDFKKKTEGIDIPFISTNVVTQGTSEPVFPPYTIVATEGRDGRPIRVGVMSVVRYNPLWQKAGPTGTNLAIASPAQMVARYLPEVRGKSDLVVLLAGIPKADAPEFARQLSGVDLMLDAYGGEYSTVEQKNGGTALVLLGNQGKRIAENRFLLDASGRIGDIVTYMHFLTDSYPDDAAARAIVDAVNAKLAPAAADPPKKAMISIPHAGAH